MIYSYDLFHDKTHLSPEEKVERRNSIRRERYEFDSDYRKKQLENANKYIENNREKRNSRKRELWHKNGDKNRKDLRERYWKDPEKWRERNREYYAFHAKEICAKKQSQRKKLAQLTQGPNPLHTWTRLVKEYMEEKE